MRRCPERWDTTINWTSSGKSRARDFSSGEHHLQSLWLNSNINMWVTCACVCVRQVHENTRRDHERTDGSSGTSGIRHRWSDLCEGGMLSWWQSSWTSKAVDASLHPLTFELSVSSEGHCTALSHSLSTHHSFAFSSLIFQLRKANFKMTIILMTNTCFFFKSNLEIFGASFFLFGKYIVRQRCDL